MKKHKESKLTLKAAALSVAGIAGTMLWQKKDLLKAIVQLRQYPDGWVLLQKKPEVFLTKMTEKSKQTLFAYLDKSPWRLVDQVADGYFWMNDKEEILLLTQKKEMNKYWSWTASRPFFDGTVPTDNADETSGDNDIELAKHVIEVEEEPEFDDIEYDMTQV